MRYFHLTKVVDKGIRRRHLRLAMIDTAMGSVLTQVVVVAIVVATAATIGRARWGASLSTIGQMADGLAPFLGRTYALLFFGLGMLGAAIAAALVVSVAGALGVSEVMGRRLSLNDSVRSAWSFYLLCAGARAASGGAVVVAPNLVNLSVDVQVMNAALLPIVLGFLLLLERRALAPAERMRGVHKWLTYGLTSLVMGIGFAAAAPPSSEGAVPIRTSRERTCGPRSKGSRQSSGTASSRSAGWPGFRGMAVSPAHAYASRLAALPMAA